jgi:DNA-binding NtrC family response regulator
MFDTVAALLTRRGHPVLRAPDATTALALAERPNVGLVVVVLPIPGTRSGEFFAQTRSILDGKVSMLVVGADDETTDAADALERGASEYVRDPSLMPADFLATVGGLLGARKVDRHLNYLRTKEAPRSGWQTIIGCSPALQRVVSTLKHVSMRTKGAAAPVIFLGGETGTGKGFVARCVHYTGVRRNKPFVEVNCAALPASLMEAELFGHERGSFTDAKTARAGLFETADTGTLFLDEIAAVPLDLQAKLLTAIEEKRVRRIGARHDVSVDVQIIAATHADLAEKVREGQFREDLFHRLNIISVTLPPLRQRGEDVLLLAESFLQAFCREYGLPVRKIADDAKEWMLAYPWPGNVRELRNQVERIVLLEDDEVVRASHFRTAVDARPNLVVTKSGTRLRLSLPDDGVSFADLEREVLREALARSNGNVSRAARFLSMSRQTFMYRMKKYGLASNDSD